MAALTSSPMSRYAPGSRKGIFTGHLTCVPLGGVRVGPASCRWRSPCIRLGLRPDLEMHGEELSQAGESEFYHQAS